MIFQKNFILRKIYTVAPFSFGFVYHNIRFCDPKFEFSAPLHQNASISLTFWYPNKILTQLLPPAWSNNKGCIVLYVAEPVLATFICGILRWYFS